MKSNALTRQAISWGISLAVLLCPSGLVAATTNISFGAFFFSPNAVTISEGDTVVWTIVPGQIANHTVTGSGSDAICGPGIVGSGCQHTFAMAGTFPYHCAKIGHAALGMTGVVQVVRPGLAPAMLTNVMRLPSGQFRFTARTTANHTNIVQASTNLVPSNWLPIGTVVPGSNSFVFTDTNAAGLRLRFYRVVEP